MSTDNILIVDDTKMMRMMVKLILDKPDRLFEFAADGEEAFELIKKNTYDLIISDIHMPKVSGIELCLKVRNELKLKSLPIFIMTVDTKYNTVETVFEAGATDFITKPINELELASRVQRILEQRDTERALMNARREAEIVGEQKDLASRYKTDFLSKMSHEFRTPLNSLLLLTYSLLENSEKNLIANQLASLETIYGSGTQLLGLINDMLDLSKIEAGKVNLEITSFSATDLIDYVNANFQILADNNQLELHCEAQTGLPDQWLTDQQKVIQIIQNLMSNALKFTEQGSVTFRIRRPEPAENLPPDLPARQEVVVIEVVDSGCGIARKEYGCIFEAFEQAEAEKQYQSRGTGLGLSISRELARYLGGSIMLDSEVGKGSTFTLYLPEKIDNHELLASEVLLPPKIDLADSKKRGIKTNFSLDLDHKTILVVDDEARNVYGLTNLLQKHGATVVTAFSGPEALQCLVAQPQIDLVLMDIVMPKMDGYSCIEAIREQARWHSLPIIALNAKVMKEDDSHCLNKGANDFITKPVDQSALFSKLKKWLKL